MNFVGSFLDYFCVLTSRSVGFLPLVEGASVFLWDRSYIFESIGVVIRCDNSFYSAV